MNTIRHAVVALALAAAATLHADDQILHFFAGGALDGAVPQGDMTISGTTLYGMAGGGGANDAGVVYRLNADGSAFTLLKNLPTGSNPSGSLALGGSTLYGMTNGGGTSGFGTVFKIDTDGGSYSVLHNFISGGDGRGPLGSLLLAGSTLYGMAASGGSSNGGVIFRINTDGSGFGILHTFVGGSSDGRFPIGSLIIEGSTLYGMTANGGASNGGVVFKMDTAGAGFGVLQSFAGGNPQGSLILSGSTLYGTTNSGGGSGAGTVFQVGTDGGGFNVLHAFTGASDDGGLPSGSLTLVDGALFGTTQTGGTSGLGTVFRMDLDGAGFDLLHSFAGDNDDGTSPQGSLAFLNGRLYGTTAGGGPTVNGAVFSVAVPEPGPAGLLAAGLLVMLLRAARNRP